MIRPSAIATVREVEKALEESLAALRKLDSGPSSNTLARTSIEYRIGALRRRKTALEQRPA